MSFIDLDRSGDDVLGNGYLNLLRSFGRGGFLLFRAPSLCPQRTGGIFTPESI
jgi:hypothetical protein